jgi:small-conductance mechanosensitive channel
LRRLLTVLGCAALLGAGVVQAQEAVPGAAAPSLSPPPAEPIALAQVAAQADEAERSASRIGEIAAPTAQISGIESELEEQAEGLAERARRSKALAGDPSSLVALDDDLRGWEYTRDQLAAARVAVTERLTALEAALEDLSHQREVWKVTEEKAREAVAPDAVLERIGQVRRTLRDARAAIESRRDELLGLQTRIAEEEKRAADSLQLLTDARSSFRSLMLLRDSPPLWRAATAEGRSSLLDDVVDRLGVRARSFARFFAVSWERALVHGVLLAIAIAATLALRRRSQAWRADDPRLEASAVVFERPFSAALLIALLATPLLYPKAPRVVDNLAVALLVIPLLRLLPRLLEPALVPTAYALAAFAVFDQLRDVLEKRPFAERTLLLVQTLAAAALLWWMLRPGRLAALPAGTRLPGSVGRVLRLALLLLLFAAVANVAGWVNLSRVVASGVLGSAYLAVILYGAVRVLRTAARALLRSDRARRLGLVRHRAASIGDWTRRAIHGAALLAWAAWTAVAFGIDDSLREALASALSAEASFGSAKVSLGDVLAFLLTLVGSFVLARVLRVLLEEDVLPRLPARRGIGTAITSTVQYAVIGVGFLLAVSAAGVDLNQFSLLAGALGVGVGFGLQNVVNNFVSGLILLYERPVQIGDMVEVGDVSGEVKRIGIRSSTIRTFQGAEVIVPNANLIADRVVNWTLSDNRRRMEVKVGVAYGTDPERVLTLLEEVARANPDVLDEPPPVVLFAGFGESSLDFELYAWSAAFETTRSTQSQLAVAVHRALVEAGIEIPFPQRDLHLRTADPKLLGALRDDAP